MKMSFPFVFCFGMTTILSHANDTPALLPLPRDLRWEEGSFLLSPDSVVIGETGAGSEAERLRRDLAARTGLPLPPGVTPDGAIELRLDPGAADEGEGYRLTVTEDGVRIVARSCAGLFYGGRTLLQMLEETPSGWAVRCAKIADAPRFPWRGLMLDEARHFMGKDYVLHLLDTMAAHKMNTLHWHLTDDQGWRIEIKAFPKLTSVGAWRGEGEALPTPSWDLDREGHPGEARYGGFHTQDDIREIVAYAEKLHIRIIPEVDVPGHASAITTAYPETLPTTDGDAGKSVHGLRGDVISVVREENYDMLRRVFTEIAGLFPAPYIHVGGDEVNVKAWETSPEHRTFMEEQGMTDPHQLQNHFMLRLESILDDLGRTLVGWNEIMHGGQLGKDTIVMSWTGTGPGMEAARQGHPVVMCPGPHCYFDMKYPGPDETGHFWAGIVSTQKAYDWNPALEGQLGEEEQERIRGVQCCLWTEYVPNPADADYKFWPRACATAEVGWSPQDARAWDDFDARLGRHLGRLDRLRVAYRVRPPTAVLDRGVVTIMPPYPGSRVFYTTDGSEPDASSREYNGERLELSDPSLLRYRTLGGRGCLSKTATGAERLPVAEWAPDRVTTEFEPVRFKLDDGAIDAAGVWRLSFGYRRGAHKIVIRDVKLLQNGAEIARDSHQGHAGSQHVDNVYRLPVPSHGAGDAYAVIAEIRSDGGNDSFGVLTLDHSPYLEPEATARTAMPAYGHHVPEKACDWNPSSFFWSSRGGRKGDNFTIEFREPVRCTQVGVQTGKPESNADIVLDGTLHLSEDGELFASVANLVMGAATHTEEGGMTLKALRITVDADQDTWVIVRDPRIK